MHLNKFKYKLDFLGQLVDGTLMWALFSLESIIKKLKQIIITVFTLYDDVVVELLIKVTFFII